MVMEQAETGQLEEELPFLVQVQLPAVKGLGDIISLCGSTVLAMTALTPPAPCELAAQAG